MQQSKKKMNAQEMESKEIKPFTINSDYSNHDEDQPPLKYIS